MGRDSSYEAPSITEIGSVAELTLNGNPTLPCDNKAGLPGGLSVCELSD